MIRWFGKFLLSPAASPHPTEFPCILVREIIRVSYFSGRIRGQRREGEDGGKWSPEAEALMITLNIYFMTVGPLLWMQVFCTVPTKNRLESSIKTRGRVVHSTWEGHSTVLVPFQSYPLTQHKELRKGRGGEVVHHVVRGIYMLFEVQLKQMGTMQEHSRWHSYWWSLLMGNVPSVIQSITEYHSSVHYYNTCTLM